MLATVCLHIIEALTYSSGCGEYSDRLMPSLIFACFAVPFTFLNLLYFMLGFEHAGYLVRLILEVINGIRYFMLILGITLLGFSVSFVLMYNIGSRFDEDEDGIYGNGNMLLYVYAMMLGDFNSEAFAKT